MITRKVWRNIIHTVVWFSFVTFAGVMVYKLASSIAF
jgi:hypothetical protein